MWWLFSPRIRSICIVTPASNAKDCNKCETISVDTAVSRIDTSVRSIARLTVPDLLAREGEVADEERSRGDINHGSSKGLKSTKAQA